MVEASQGAGFAKELLASLGQGFSTDAAGGPDLFDGAEATGQAAVGSLVYRTHSALANEAKDLISFSE
jgi:hypothetical protein